MRAVPVAIRELHQLGGIRQQELVGPSCRALTAAGLDGCGVMRADPPYGEQRPAPRFAGLIATLAGRGAAVVDGAWQPLPPGSVLALPPMAAHAYAAASPGWRLAWVAGPAAPRPLLRSGRPWIATADGAGLALAISGLRGELNGRADGAMLALLAGQVRREAELLLMPADGDPALWHLWREVGSDLARPWPLHELARRCGLGPEALRRRCQAAHGCSPGVLVRRMRLDAAAAMLGQGGRGLAGIADLVGYASPFALSAAFTRRFGHPPARWRG